MDVYHEITWVDHLWLSSPCPIYALFSLSYEHHCQWQIRILHLSYFLQFLIYLPPQAPHPHFCFGRLLTWGYGNHYTTFLLAFAHLLICSAVSLPSESIKKLTISGIALGNILLSQGSNFCFPMVFPEYAQ
jgi:hypothetical protein